jgi:pimeloyl-ACP methyl ester carboxylesterase
MSNTARRIMLSSLIAILIALCSGSVAAQTHITGTLPDGATYVIDLPPLFWNGILLLYSHGYVAPGSPNPAQDFGDPDTGGYMLAAGYALAGSSYATTGWAVHEAIPDQIATLDVFESLFGTPLQTIAWGHSMGGEVTAGLLQQYPNRFHAALPMCGVLAGSVGHWNQYLDTAFIFNVLLAGGALQVVHITDPYQNLATAEVILSLAQTTAQGRARIALAVALGDTPGWYDPASPEPAPTDYATQEANQFLWEQNVDFPAFFVGRAEVEARAGGNPSFNTGVNYETKLQHSVDYAEVQALYAAAGLSLDADLAALKKASRIQADPGALAYLSENIIYNGQLSVPVLTLHTTGDGVVPVQEERAYKATARKAGNQSLVHDLFLHRAGHCQITPAETITAFQHLTTRLATGEWTGLSPSNLNAEATALGPGYNVLLLNGQIVYVAPEFEIYRSLPFLRPFDAFSQ